jgi:hypothetical protein
LNWCFRNIDVLRLGLEEAADLIKARDIGVELAAALQYWALDHRGRWPKDDITWKKLLAIARDADPDKLRSRLQDALVRGDRRAPAEFAASE